ncbi:DUF2239 family protein [Deinococcus oregonensis]|uniref:DUF2239 family protein n=1 Tax=Deinococcus oregonensis TaxID=1805970 RepID=A0ABV6AXS4_9DEIO
MSEPTYTALVDDHLLFHGTLPALLHSLKAHEDHHASMPVIFEDHTGLHIDFDLRGTLDEVLSRYTPTPESTERPKASASTREITLLPRHWSWLDEHGSASATLRRLVDTARLSNIEKQTATRATEAARHFITAMAGNRPQYEEALRALYASNEDSFTNQTRTWPKAIRDTALRLATPAFTFHAQNHAQKPA